MTETWSNSVGYLPALPRARSQFGGGDLRIVLNCFSSRKAEGRRRRRRLPPPSPISGTSPSPTSAPPSRHREMGMDSGRHCEMGMKLRPSSSPSLPRSWSSASTSGSRGFCPTLEAPSRRRQQQHHHRQTPQLPGSSATKDGKGASPRCGRRCRCEGERRSSEEAAARRPRGGAARRARGAAAARAVVAMWRWRQRESRSGASAAEIKRERTRSCERCGGRQRRGKEKSRRKNEKKGKQIF